MTDSTTTTAPVAPDQTGVREIIEAEILDDFIGLFPEDELSVRAAASRTAYRSMRRISTLTPAPAAGDDRVTVRREDAIAVLSAAELCPIPGFYELHIPRFRAALSQPGREGEGE